MLQGMVLTFNSFCSPVPEPNSGRHMPFVQTGYRSCCWLADRKCHRFIRGKAGPGSNAAMLTLGMEMQFGLPQRMSERFFWQLCS